MSKLSSVTLFIFAFSPLAVTTLLIGGIAWLRNRSPDSPADNPRRLLAAVVHLMTGANNEWGTAMLAELDHVSGRFARWQFALGCVKALTFPPIVTAWPRCWFGAIRRFEHKCGVLSVALPPLGLPLLVLAAFAAENFTSHDNFFNGELVPGLVGVFILSSLACMLAGVPFGIAGIIMRERALWLSLTGPLLSLAIFSYTMLVQHIANRNL